jgi:hypothetical protein
MSEEINIKEAERKVFRSAFQDGLVEIMLGSFVLMFAVAPLLSHYLGDFWSSFVFLPFWAAVYGLLWLVRRHVVQPRMGEVDFGAWRRTRLKRFTVVMLVVCTLGLILGILSFIQFAAVPGWIHTARFSLVLLIGFSIAAYFLDYPALYLYGTLIALAPLVGEVLWTYFQVPHHGFPVVFGLAAAFLVLAGLVKLARFVRTHPLPDNGAPLERPANG